MPDSDPIPTLVWLDPEQVSLVRAVAERANLRIVAVGSPARGRSRDLAESLGGQPIDDLRAALSTTTNAAAAWLAAPGDFGAGSIPSDLEAIRAFRSRGSKIATSEPIPASALERAAGAWSAVFGGAAAAGAVGGGGGGGGVGGELLRFVPRTRLSRPVLEAAEVLDAFGPVRTVAFEAWSGRGEGSLGARLLDAMDVIAWLLGEPETIDASYIWPGKGVRDPGAIIAGDGSSGGGVAGAVGSGGVVTAGVGGALHKLPGESLRDLHGDLTCNCRFADGRGAAVVLSDCAGRWNRSIALLGPGGRIRIYDDGFEWVAPDGRRIDASRGLGGLPLPPGADERTAATAGGALPGRSAAVFADALHRYFTGREATPAPIDEPRVLAMAGAALLSARTGEAESPATITRMAAITA